jgi:cell division protein FtsB
MLIEHLAGQLEKLASNIETGKAPYDQQQKLTLDFYKTRIEKLEEHMEKLKDKVLNGKH